MNTLTISTDTELAFSHLAIDIQKLLTDTDAAYHYFPAHQVAAVCQTMGIDHAQLGLQLLPLAAAFAVTPISNFNVGAVAFDSLGNAYLGANFEFSGVAINQTIHAEQSAIANAWACGAKDIALLVVNYAPCGHCRQFLNEVEVAVNFRIQLPKRQAQPLSYYLPDAFGPFDLGIQQRILERQLPTQTTNLTIQATAACQVSHAPYSGNQSGIALRYDDAIVMGCYAENAAFNPSLPPLQMALNTRRLQGKNWQLVHEALMVEHNPSLSQRQQATELLTSFTNINLTYLTGSLVDKKRDT